MSTRFPAEWEAQDGVLLAWPHPETDWHPYIDRVEPVFVRIVEAICRFERALVVAHDREHVRKVLEAGGVPMDRVTLVEIPSNDTWARDFGPITVEQDGKPYILDFGFNGWGLKFPSNLDNQITAELHELGIFGQTPREIVGMIFEGGGIESDGAGTLLTTSECLENCNRNPHLERSQIEAQLKELLGAQHILWLENGYLAGDDTDSHVDTLARLCPDDSILYQRCDDPQDEHYGALTAMEEELRAFRTQEGKPYRLIPLPWPEAKFDEEGERLPATYANYLIINGAVLLPVYEDPRDAQAIEAAQLAFPDRQILPIDCSALILQHGSLHCVTMQLPKGVLA